MEYHVFLTQKMGWEKERGYICFPCDEYPTRKDAEAEFTIIEGETDKNGHIVPYKACEYQGEKYYKAIYQGVFDEDDLPGYD